ncbi:hypothetical protein [Nocardiopsis coralliicola]
MAREETLTTVNRLPDHGHGPLGQVAHGVLAAAGDAPADRLPRLYTGYNTLPGAPYPLAGFLPYCAGAGPGAEAGGDPGLLLAGAAAAVRGRPLPDPGAYSADYRRLHRLLRIDAQLVACAARVPPALRAAHGCSGAAEPALPAPAVPGPPGPVPRQPGGPGVAVWAVDRQGSGLALWIPPLVEAATGRPVPLVASRALRAGEPLSGALADLLEAQAAWAGAAFAG